MTFDKETVSETENPWQVVFDGRNQPPNQMITDVFRMEVPGGWLYRTRNYGWADGIAQRELIDTHVVFVPTPPDPSESKLRCTEIVENLGIESSERNEMMDQNKRAFVQQEISRWIVGQIERTDLSPEAHSILEHLPGVLNDIPRKTLQFLAQPSMESTILRDAVRNAAQFIALLQGVQDGVSDVFEPLVPITNSQIQQSDLIGRSREAPGPRVQKPVQKP